MLDAEGGVYVVAGDQWIWRRRAKDSRVASDEDAQAADLRAKQVDGYYEEQRRTRPRVVDGVSEWMGE